jgi:hypothetical protein
MDDVSNDPFAVNADLAEATKSLLGRTPTAFTTETISSSTASANLDPRGAFVTSPIVPRIKQLIPPRPASRIHFSHLSRSMADAALSIPP